MLTVLKEASRAVDQPVMRVSAPSLPATPRVHNFGRKKIDIIESREGRDIIVTWKPHPANLWKLQLEHRAALQKYLNGKLVEAQ